MRTRTKPVSVGRRCGVPLSRSAYAELSLGVCPSPEYFVRFLPRTPRLLPWGFLLMSLATCSTFDARHGRQVQRPCHVAQSSGVLFEDERIGGKATE